MRDRETPIDAVTSPPERSPSAVERVTLAHGEGGRLMRQLIREEIAAVLYSDRQPPMDDATRLPPCQGPLAMTTDSFVVSPLFFPGGDIGSLAVYGTVNDLAVAGAEPRYLTLSLILEEGFLLTTLREILMSVSRAASEARVSVVAGDTKVVPRGAVDGLFINTTGVGQFTRTPPTGPSTLHENDVVLVSGSIGRHGMAILCAREELAFSPPPKSDCAPLCELARQLQSELGTGLRAMRDATRGGVAAVLHEWALQSGKTLAVVQSQLPVNPAVRGACELLGLDPIHVANEGTMVIAVTPDAADSALRILRQTRDGQLASIIGRVTARKLVPVTITRSLGVEQPLDEPAGAPLPRIC